MLWQWQVRCHCYARSRSQSDTYRWRQNRNKTPPRRQNTGYEAVLQQSPNAVIIMRVLNLWYVKPWREMCQTWPAHHEWLRLLGVAVCSRVVEMLTNERVNQVTCVIGQCDDSSSSSSSNTCQVSPLQPLDTTSSAVAKRPRDASCLSVVSFNSTKRRVVFYY